MPEPRRGLLRDLRARGPQPQAWCRRWPQKQHREGTRGDGYRLDDPRGTERVHPPGVHRVHRTATDGRAGGARMRYELLTTMVIALLMVAMALMMLARQPAPPSPTPQPFAETE